MIRKILSITPKNETHTWLEPGAWRKPCIVHVTMVANSRQALFGKLNRNMYVVQASGHSMEPRINNTPASKAMMNLAIGSTKR